MPVTFRNNPSAASCHKNLSSHSKRADGSFCILTRAFAGPLRSGTFARVKVMQAADFWNLDHMTERRKLDGSADRRIFFERQMRTASLRAWR